MTYLRIVIPLSLLAEHDPRIRGGKPSPKIGVHPRLRKGMLFGIMLSIANVTLGVDGPAAQERLRKLDRLVTVDIDGGTEDEESQSQDRDQRRTRAGSAWRRLGRRAVRTGAHLMRKRWRMSLSENRYPLFRDMH